MMVRRNSKKICIINTGGTIGMKPSNNGFVPVKGYLSEQLQALSELNHPDMPDYHIIEYDPLIDSANATPQFWRQIMDTIVDYYDQYDGFVILHGTDTMAYTASALSFMFDNLSKPILLTGSQVPIACIPSDARSNIVNALYLASYENICEVGICFSNKLYRGNRTTKQSAVSYNAFGSPNYPVLGVVSSTVHIYESQLLPRPVNPFKANEFVDVNIGVVRLIPGVSTTFLEHALQHPLQALIIQTYGVGNAPDNKGFVRILSKAAENNLVIVNCTQCLHGGVKTHTYATGNFLTQAGVVSGADMTLEATIAKLTYLFSNALSSDEIKQQLSINLRGEMTEQ